LSGFALAAALAAAPVAAADMRQSVDAWRAAHEAAIVGQLDELTRF